MWIESHRWTEPRGITRQSMDSSDFCRWHRRSRGPPVVSQIISNGNEGFSERRFQHKVSVTNMCRYDTPSRILSLMQTFVVVCVKFLVQLSVRSTPISWSKHQQKLPVFTKFRFLPFSSFDINPKTKTSCGSSEIQPDHVKNLSNWVSMWSLVQTQSLTQLAKFWPLY